MDGAVSCSAAWPRWGLRPGQGGHGAPLGAVPPAWSYLGRGPRQESSVGAGEWVGFSIRKPPPEKSGGSSGGCGVVEVQGL